MNINYAEQVIYDNAWIIRWIANLSELYLMVDGKLIRTP